MVQLSSWGNYPVIDAHIYTASSVQEVRNCLVGAFIPRGMARSYGDSALFSRVLDMRALHQFHDFDTSTGILTCDAGVSFDEIIKVFLPRGWFLPVTPGTRFITVGGAVASDIHGKNHHVEGSFCDHVVSMSLLLGNGDILKISPTEYTDLFRASCGGMGLTGVILSVSFQLISISSGLIDQTLFKTRNLEETLTCFEKNASCTYSVAWIDCLAKGKNMGRSLVMLGEHATSGSLAFESKTRFTMPGLFPAQMLNTYSISIFNQLYYHRIQKPFHNSRVPLASFFYPLDNIADWNNMYGKAGFLQYQFVLPFASKKGLELILEKIADSGSGSFLAVLKIFGNGNKNLLSFPMPGYTLALDFKRNAKNMRLLKALDQIVLSYGGRLYLSKDACMSESFFKASYPTWEKFESVREKYEAHGHFKSMQSRRLGLL